MTAIITEKFRSHNADQFFESFTEASGNAYYLMIGKPNPYTSATSGGTDESPPTPADDISSEFYAWDSAVAAKKIASTNITYALPRRNWANSTIYDMYEYILDKEELRRDDKVMDFLSQYKYDIHRDVSESLYGGKKRKYSKRRRPRRKNKTRSKR